MAGRHAENQGGRMTVRETITEIIGSICFIVLLCSVTLALYVVTPQQPSMHSEIAYMDDRQ